MTVADAPTFGGGGPSISSDDILSLDQSYVKLPFEQSRRAFRNELKVVDKDVANCNTLLRQVNFSDPEMCGKMAARLRATAEKLREAAMESAKYRNRLSMRLNDLKQVVDCSNAMVSDGGSSSSSSLTAMPLHRWQHSRLQRVIVEFLLQKELFQSAQSLIDHFNLTDHVDLELYEEAARIRKSLLNGSVAECLAWCSENRPSLRKCNSPLEFMLRRQEFVELVRSRSLELAIQHAQKHFVPFMDQNKMEIQQALALLAVPSNFAVFPYNWLYDVGRWEDLALQFEMEVRSLHSLPERSQLLSIIQAGLAALKTHHCVGEQDRRNINCPVCSEPLSELVSELPFAHHETSIMVCPISGQQMDDDNIPMTLPNGHVYSQKALDAMIVQQHGVITCPRTNQTFNAKDLRKCYIT